MERLTQYDVFSIPVEHIFYDASFNCRGEFTPQSVKELADSIEQNGLQFPVVVQPWRCSEWRLIAGHRRYMAITRFLKWTHIPATVREGLTDYQARFLNFTENLERRDLNILEEARAIRALFPGGASLRTMAKELKRPSRWVHIRMRLLALPEDVQKAASTGLLSALNIEAVIGLEDETEQVKAAEAIVAAKRRGKTKHLPHHRNFQQRRSKEQINKMIGVMLDRQIPMIASRGLAWAAGYVSDDELLAEINTTSKHRERSKNRATRNAV